jgi:hypothetical protein
VESEKIISGHGLNFEDTTDVDQFRLIEKKEANRSHRENAAVPMKWGMASD